MGVWGIALASSDTYSDIYDSFYEQFNASVPVDVVVAKLEEEFEDVLSDDDEAPEFIYAVTKAIWETGGESGKYLTMLSEIVKQKSEIERWVRLGGSVKDSEKRHKNVISLFEKIQAKNPKPRRPKKVKLIDSFFENGECIAFRDADGYYSAAVILSAEKQSEFGLNLVLVLDYFSTALPSIEDFKNGNCAMTKDFRGDFKPWTQYCYARDIKRIKTEVLKVGKVDISTEYPYQVIGHSFGAWNLISDWMRKRDETPMGFPKIKATSMYK